MGAFSCGVARRIIAKSVGTASEIWTNQVVHNLGAIEMASIAAGRTE